jgi:hypothetical protein
VLVEVGRAGDLRAEVEQAAGLSGGEGMRSRPFSSFTNAGGAYVLGGVKRCPQVSGPLFNGRAWAFPLAAAASGRAARAVTARKAQASAAKVACRYQARYLRTW